MGILALRADERVTHVSVTKDTLSVGLGDGHWRRGALRLERFAGQSAVYHEVLMSRASPRGTDRSTSTIFSAAQPSI